MHVITDYYATGLYTYKKLLLSFYYTCFTFINQRSNKVCCVTWLVASFILCLVILLAHPFFGCVLGLISVVLLIMAPLYKACIAHIVIRRS